MKDNTLALALKIIAPLSGWIAGPIIIGLFLGKWLDKHFNTEPWLFLTTIGFCFLISMFGLVINAKKEFAKIEAEAAADKEKSLSPKK
jgi:F0F1-type ATP synthase assembly protein I